MTITAQDALPEITLHIKDEDGLQELTLAEWAKDKKVVLFCRTRCLYPYMLSTAFA